MKHESIERLMVFDLQHINKFMSRSLQKVELCKVISLYSRYISHVMFMLLFSCFEWDDNQIDSKTLSRELNRSCYVLLLC